MTSAAPATFPVVGSNGVVASFAGVANPDGTQSPNVNTQGMRQTYGAVSYLQTITTNGGQDVIVLPGSATKTVQLTKLTIGGTVSTAVTIPVLLLKRSTANAGGTSAALTIIPLDSLDAAATAAPVSYSVNSTTTGTSLGVAAAFNMALHTTANSSNDLVSMAFGLNGAKPPTLHGVAENICINLNGFTTGAPVLCTSLEWIEF